MSNDSQDQDFTFENCLHAYFLIGDITAISVSGLKGADYVDKADGFLRKTERADHVKISRETNSIYLNTPAGCGDSRFQIATRASASKNPGPFPRWCGIRGWTRAQADARFRQ